MYYVKNLITAFTASNLTETYAVWNSATTYVLQTGTPTSASICRDGAWYYRSVINGNLNLRPSEYEGTKWVKYSIANSHAMLDFSAQSLSYLSGGNMTVTFDLPFGSDAIGMGYYECDTVLIELLDASNVVVWTYQTDSTYSENVYDWYTWTFATREQDLGRSLAVRIPAFIGTKCRITWRSSAYQTRTACGFLSCGIATDMGKTKNNIKFNPTSYSVRKVDEFGDLSIVKRSVSKTVDFQTTISRALFMRKQRAISADIDSIMMFVIDDTKSSQFENIVVLGVMQAPVPILDEYDMSIISWVVFEAI